MSDTALVAPRYDATAAEWAERLFVAVRNICFRRYVGIFEADDAAAEIMIPFCECPDRFVFRCGTPEEWPAMSEAST